MSDPGEGHDRGALVEPDHGSGAQAFDVPALAPAADPARKHGRPAAKRLLQGDGANLIAFTFSPGQALPDHTAAHPITVQCLSGTLTFTCEGETTELRPGTVVHCRERVVHRVDCPAEAPESNVLLLTMLTGERR